MIFSPVLVTLSYLALQTGGGMTASCQDGLLPAFGGDNKSFGLADDFALFDRSSGPELYAAGFFRAVNGEVAQSIARRDGTQWRPVDLPIGNTIKALEAWDDGTGESLYIGGTLTINGTGPNEGLFEWDGTHIQAVGGGLSFSVTDLLVWDDGMGEALYVCGGFTTLTGPAISYLAKWNGVQWAALGTGIDGPVTDLAVYDDGTGSSLYAVGSFANAGGIPANRIARWDGTTWHALGSSPIPSPRSLAVHDDGNGPGLFVGGGEFFAKWNGTSWLTFPFSNADDVRMMAVLKTSTGEELFGGGRYGPSGSYFELARWNGSSWAAVPGVVVDDVQSIFARPSAVAGETVLEFSGSAVFEGERVSFFSYDGGQWSGARATGLDARVDAVHTYTRNGISTLILAGRFTRIGGVPLNTIVEWDGQTFDQIASGFATDLNQFGRIFRDFEVFDDGTGEALYLGGYFNELDGLPLTGIARWDGTNWTGLNGGIGDGDDFGVDALLVHDDGSGPALYAGGKFSPPFGSSGLNLARWDGSAWFTVGNLSTIAGSTSQILSLAEYDDGTGNALYVGGDLTAPSGGPQRDLLRWDGSTWSAVLGSSSYLPYLVSTMAVYGEGSEKALYAFGNFSPIPFGANPVGRWDGQEWTPVSPGLFGRFTDALVVDGGNGPALIATGGSLQLDGIPAGPGVSWDGLSWKRMTTGWAFPGRDMYSLALYDSGSGPELWIGGEEPASPTGDSYLVRFRACSPGDDYCFADSAPLAGCEPCPCGNALNVALRGGCSNSVGTGARLASSGTNEVAAGDLRFDLEAAVPNSVALLVSGQVALPAQGPCPAGRGVQSSVFDGLRCMGTGLLRHGTRPTDINGQSGTTNAGWGPPNGPGGGIPAQASAVAGQTRYFQAIYRDDIAASCGTGLNTSNGVRVLFR